MKFVKANRSALAGAAIFATVCGLTIAPNITLKANAAENSGTATSTEAQCAHIISKKHTDLFTFEGTAENPVLKLIGSPDGTKGAVTLTPETVQYVVSEVAYTNLTEMVPDGIKGVDAYNFGSSEAQQQLPYAGLDTNKADEFGYGKIDFKIDVKNGPGEIYLYEYGTNGFINHLGPGIYKLPGTLHQDFPKHEHPQWGVTKPGNYQLIVTPTLTKADSNETKTLPASTYYLRVGTPTSADAVSDTVEEGATANLPATVQVHWPHDTVTTEKVVWDSQDAVKSAHAGETVTVQGTVQAGCVSPALKATANITIKAKPTPTPPAANPPADTPPATNPPATNPPAANPPADTPPASTPPAANPPASTPPATNPPAANPPASTPPAEEPETEKPPLVGPHEAGKGDIDLIHFDIEEGTNKVSLNSAWNDQAIDANDITVVTPESAKTTLPSDKTIPADLRGKEAYLIDGEDGNPGFDTDEIVEKAGYEDHADFNISVDGPGELYMWKSNDDAKSSNTDMWLTNSYKLPGDFHQASLGHVHPRWVATAPGDYVLNVTATIYKNGVPEKVGPVKYKWRIGDPKPASQPAPQPVAPEAPAAAPEAPAAPAVVPNINTDKKEYGIGEAVQFRLTGFTPGAKVTVTLHSDPYLVGVFTADANGVVEGSFVPPAGFTGHHTLIGDDGVNHVETGLEIGNLALTGVQQDALLPVAVAVMLLGACTLLARRRTR